MYKKVFISFLLFAFINLLVGCYSSELVTVAEYKKNEQEDKPDAIRVFTKDLKEYHFSDSNFYIENDTLIGIINGRAMSFEGKIAISEIEAIQLEYFDKKHHSTMSVSQFQKIEAEDSQPDEIYVLKTNGTKLHFAKADYEITNDTLHGRGRLILSSENEILNKKIALSKIESIELENFNVENTFLLSGGLLVALAIGFVIVTVVVLTNWADK
jgi:hypothetical protein